MRPAASQPITARGANPPAGASAQPGRPWRWRRTAGECGCTCQRRPPGPLLVTGDAAAWRSCAIPENSAARVVAASGGASTMRPGRDTAALRWFFEQTPGEANSLVLHYKTDLLTSRKSTGTTARHLSVVKSLAKYARMTGLITWAIEVTSPRIERSRDVRGPQGPEHRRGAAVQSAPQHRDADGLPRPARQQAGRHCGMGVRLLGRGGDAAMIAPAVAGAGRIA